MPASKFITARNNSKVGKYPRTFDALWGKLSDSLIAASTGKQLAAVIDQMYDQNQIGHSQGYRDAQG